VVDPLDPPDEDWPCPGCHGDGWLNLNGLRVRHRACGGSGYVSKKDVALDAKEIKAQERDDEMRGK
jgi:hypothetical protein